ncbi:Leucine Rich Repeat [Seminavis robusta]|uniref:Leucine Rich Repeat n=1 Tax=Seminavis robusta TaxID=568900 RepID=A0A9N8HAI3_9STRA|nr:Leucine Rich Repeat [Seminavis robusta]|eukprot:Sro321_g116720.1 Leucine Rich Repeat (826) ;mRNA; f:31616-34213
MKETKCTTSTGIEAPAAPVEDEGKDLEAAEVVPLVTEATDKAKAKAKAKAEATQDSGSGTQESAKAAKADTDESGTCSIWAMPMPRDSGATEATTDSTCKVSKVSRGSFAVTGSMGSITGETRHPFLQELVEDVGDQRVPAAPVPSGKIGKIHKMDANAQSLPLPSASGNPGAFAVESPMASASSTAGTSVQLAPPLPVATTPSTVSAFAIQPLPDHGTRPTRNTDQIHQGPGAVAVRGRPLFATSTSPGQRQRQNNTTATSTSSNQGLAVANLVDEEVHPAFPAEPQSSTGTTATQKTKDKTKQLKTNILLLAMLLIAIATVAIAVVVSGNKKNNTVASSVAPTISPSAAPTSLEASILSLLPDETISAITNHAGSPQAKAWQWLLQDPSLSSLSSSEERIQQRFALATFFFATQGDKWAVNTHWLDYTVHECEWFQKEEFARKDLIAKFLPGFLTNFFPSTTTVPPRCNVDGLLQQLWLDQNNLAGSIPEELFLLTNLQTVSMALNELQGTISTNVGMLTALEGLSIADLEDAGTIPSEIGVLTNLRFLSIDRNNHQGSIPSELWQLTNLDTLGLTTHPQLKGSLPTEIGLFSNLRWLIMDNCDYSGTIPTEIGLATTLEWLVLLENRFSGTLPSEVGTLPNIVVFSVAGDMMEGTLPTELGLLTTLTLLRFADNQFSGAVPTEFGLLTELNITLSFKHNGFLTGTIPSELGLLSNLYELELQGNQFSGPIPKEFGQLSSLGHLTLANNLLSGMVPLELSALGESLYALTMEGNPLLQGTIPEAVCNVSSTCVGNAMHVCEGEGLSFDCTNLLCGCGCDCDLR